MKKPIIYCVLILFGFCLSFFKDGIIYRSAKFFQKITLIYDKSVDENFISGLNYVADTIKIYIPKENFILLNKMREDAIKGIKDFKYVDAKILVMNDTSKMKIKLKGDRKIHFNKNIGWSFRIKSKNLIYKNLKAFSLHHPGTKNYIYEWIYHKLLKEEGIHNLNYTFLNVNVNGENWGVYALEEFISQEYYKNNSLSESAVYRFIEDFGFHYSDVPLFKPFKGSYKKNDTSKMNISNAIKLMSGFRKKHLKVSDVFDAEKMAKLFAIQDVFGFQHGSVSKSIRFYFNPVSQRLEPIGYDGHFGCDGGNSYLSIEFPFSNKSWHSDHDKEWFSLFFNSSNLDTNFISYYLKALEKYSSHNYIDSFLNRNEYEIKKGLGLIFQNYPPLYDHIGHFGPEKFKYDSSFAKHKITHVIQKINPNKAIHSYVSDLNDELITLEISNIQYFPIKIMGLITMNQDTLYPKINKVVKFSDKYNFEKFHFKTKGVPYNLKKIKVFYRLIGSSKALNTSIDGSLFVKEANFNTLFDYDSSSRTISFKNSVVKIKSEIVIPENYVFQIKKGTQIDFIDSGSITSYSPPVFNGTLENPIVFTSSDSSSKGLTFITDKETGLINHVKFKKFKLNNTLESGLINLHKTNIKFNSCEFENINFKNIIKANRCKILISNSKFRASNSNSIDLNFCLGRIENCNFQNVYNGINTSSSEIYLKNITLLNMENTGFEILENSKVLANNIDITDANAGVLCYDNSELKIQNLIIRNAEIGLAAFQKKKEYDKSIIFGKNIVFENIKDSCISHRGSNIFINSVITPWSNSKINDLIRSL